MTALVATIRKKYANRRSPISIVPDTDYWRHAPESAEQLMRENWQKTGKSLYKAMTKVGEEICRQGQQQKQNE